jgi:hypothetical protein
MINVNQITAQMARMSDQALQQYAAMHKADPYTLSLALSESNRRKELRQAAQMGQQQPQPKVVDQEISQMGPQMAPPQQGMPPQGAPQGMPPQQLPEDVGIGQLPAPNMQRMAAGGIVAFDEGGEVPGYDKGGVTKLTPMQLFEKALDREGVQDPIERAFAKSIYLQESGGGKNTNTSNQGAVGGMQIVPRTFKSVADKDMDINNPFDNMRAGIRYARQGLAAAGGNTDLAGAYYYGGPNGLAKAKQGIGISDPKNPKAPDTLQYAKEVGARMPVLTGGAAVAATPTAAPSGPSLVDRIPGQTGAVPEPVKTKPLTGNEMVTGAGETALQYGTGLLSLPFAAAAGAIKPGVPFEQAFSEAHKAMTYSPRTAGGQEVSEATSKALSGLPAIIPGATTAGMARGPLKNLPASTTAAREALSKSEQARAPRLPYEKPPTPVSAIPEGLTPEAVATREAAVSQRQAREQTAKQQRQQTAMAGQAQDIAAADDALAAASARAAKNQAGIDILKKETDYTQGASNRAQNIATGAVAGAAGAGAPGVGAAGGLPDMAKAMNLDEENRVIQQAPPDIAPKDIQKIGKEATPKSERKGMSGEDFLMIGLGILSGQSPNALTNIGEGGLKGLQMVQASRKEASEAAAREKMAERYGIGAEVQLVNAMQDPAFAARYRTLVETKNDPRQLQALAQEMLKTPGQMEMLKKLDPALYSMLRSSVLGGFAPAPISSPGGSAAIRAPIQ